MAARYVNNSVILPVKPASRSAVRWKQAVRPGCATSYGMNDPAGMKEYYTTDINETKTRAITFKDENTGSDVRLQSLEVKKISKNEINAAMKGEKNEGE